MQEPIKLGKTVLGFTENVVVYGANNSRSLMARIDTGASKSSIDISLAQELGMGPSHGTRNVKSAAGIRERSVIKERIEIANKDLKVFFTLADRSHMKYKVLVGRNILRRGFLIDPEKQS